ncbi:MAG: TonB-dependent receptor plug domain-containing protein [Candidatus Eremiobacteraeota bacterium]|nr:TonB-dependent receptor plug domain-containing protein [Candidatus Eremiobacteraeota bacterium]
MIWRGVPFAMCVLLLFGMATSNALPQSESSEIQIVVVDTTTKHPLELARVLLDGPVITSEVTAKDGKVTFTDVPDGIYRARIVLRGYQNLTSASFEVLNGRAVTVTFALAPDTNGLKVIGQVTAHASATISTNSIDQNSPQRRLSTDLADALNKMSGVSVSTSSDDSNATQTISLEGHDPTQTQLTLDGIPLNAPGSAGNLSAFATDLFQGAAVHTGPTLGGLGGSVNFSTLQPTLSWISQMQLSVGSNGRYNYSVAETGSVGKLGIAVQTVNRLYPSLVDGELYQDASGLDYVHDGDSTISGNLFSGRYEFGDSNSLNAMFMNSNRTTDVVCLRYNGYPQSTLPCGYGPNNTDTSNVQLYSLIDNALIGATQLQASVFSLDASTLLNELARYVNGVASPIGYASTAKSRGYVVNATLPAKQRHTISLQAYGTSSQFSTTPLVAQAVPFYNGTETTQYSVLQATDTIHSNDKLTLSGSAGLSTATGTNGVTELGSVAATWRPTARDNYSASFSLGGAAATQGRLQVLSDPASLRFDCVGRVAYGNAPGQQPQKSSSSSARLSYTHYFHGGNVSLTLYRQQQNGVLLPVYVNGVVLNQLGQLPSGYLTQVAQLYNSPAGCSTPPGTPFTAQQLYFNTPIANVQRLYQGASLSGYFTLGNLVVQPYYNLTGAQADSSSYLFANPWSITISGQQLPNVPLIKSGIVLDYKAPHSILEWLADAQHVGANNPNNLPPYTTFDAGVTAQLTRGTLTLAASNITNAYSGIFASPANAVPFTTAGGFTIANIARPLTPRTYSATYSVRFGQGTTSQTASAFRPRGTGGGEGLFGSPGSSNSGSSSGGGGGLRSLFTPIPLTPPSDPFALAGSSALCTAENGVKARQLSGELDAVRPRIESARTAAGYPATIAMPALADATLTYHGLGNTYALSITPKGSGMLRAVASCMALHIARSDDVTQRKLFAPSSSLFFVPQITFMPAVGLYVVARTPQAGQEMFRVYKLPTTPPAQPFALRAGQSCTGDARSLATQALNDLRNHFTGGSVSASWTITAHTAKSGTWYELDPGDPSVIPALLVCSRIAATTGDELAQHGFAGKPVPELNYAPSLGLYLIRPNNRGFGGGASPAPSPPPRL